MSRKLTTEEFVVKAKSVHGDKYIYDKCAYLNAKSKVLIGCKKHGYFEQSAGDHAQGKGCKKCADVAGWEKRKATTESFIAKSNLVHGHKYNYDNTIYSGGHNKVSIECKKHGQFQQSASSHLRGHGCPSCKFEGNAARCRSTKDSFIIDANKIHKNAYDYSLVIYKNNNTKVNIWCKEHGIFSMTPSNHLAGKGCSGCTKHGFDSAKHGYVYFLMGEGAIKVGITNKPSDRLRRLTSKTPFDFNLIAKIKTTGAEAMRIEKYYHKKYESAGLTGFDGATEWLRYSPELMSEIMNENITP